MGNRGSTAHQNSEGKDALIGDENVSDDLDEEEVKADIESLPFLAIQGHLRGNALDSPELKCWIPGCPASAAIQETFYRDKACWYTIELEHGCFRWTLQRRDKDFKHLHNQLQMYRAFQAFQLPDINIRYDKERGGRRPSISVETKIVPKLPAFPSNTMEEFELYLQTLLKIPKLKNHHKTREFLEVGPYSFVKELGLKGKEGYVRRRSNCGQTSLGMLCTISCGFRKKRWLFFKENFIGLLQPKNGELESVLLLDHGFTVDSGKRKTGHSQVLTFQNLHSRKLVLQCQSKHQANEFEEELYFQLDRGISDFVSPCRYDSFAPPRSPTECKWIVDGATYFEGVAMALEAAKEEIFIADWWLSPEIYLRRPTTKGHAWQLDYVLKRKAKEGVKVYVLLYKELELALGIDSEHTEQQLTRLHSNIQVLRHPQVTKGVLLWAHHEKIVCVDQTYAFAGGIDLCYGRWDDYQHRLSDLGEPEDQIQVRRHLSKDSKQSLEEVELKKSNSLPNIKISSEEKIKDTKDDADDEAMNAKAVVENGESSKNVGVRRRHSFHMETERSPVAGEEIAKLKNTKFKGLVRKQQARKRFELIKKQLSEESHLNQDDDIQLSSLDQPADKDRRIREIALIHLDLEKKYRLWHGKDYVNFITKDFQELDKPYSDMIDRSKTCRMPWHDVGLFTQGMAARDIARHFILRWNHAKREICPEDSKKPMLMPKCYSTISDDIPRILEGTVGSLFKAECQVLRSLCFWSGNLKRTENSIQKAYVNVIRESKKFIYIENQFFISQPSGSSSVFNGIADALYYRIIKAHREKSEFHVFVVLPLLPAFEGEVGTGSGTLIQAITHWNYRSICRGRDSLIARLEKHMKNPSKYISFYGLRTHGTLNGKHVTELVYVHSKLLVADDAACIIGSANVNDRSLLGRRDSEMAVLVRDTQFRDDPPGSGHFCYTLRRALFKEHLGLMKKKDPSIDLRQPNSAAFVQNVWNKIASDNTDIYEEVFRCIPTDRVDTFDALKQYQQKPKLVDTSPESALQKLQKIRGYLVLFPLYFLCEENLEPQSTEVEHYLPSSVFT